MAFLDKIKALIPKRKKSWKETIRQEKKQKYLFWDGGGDWAFHATRNTSGMKIGKKQLNRIATFSPKNLLQKDLLKTYGYLMSMIWLVLILLCVYIIAFSPYFKISPNQVLVESTTPWVDISIAYRSLESIYWKSIFLIDEDVIAKKLKTSLKNLESVSIRRSYPNGMKILIMGSPILFDTTIVGIPEKKWWLSSNGVLIPANDMKETKAKYHLELISAPLIGDVFLQYKQVINEENMHTITRIFDIFTTEWKDLWLSQSNYFVEENELHITLESKTKVIFALQDDTLEKAGEMNPNIINQLITFRTYLTDNREKLKNGSIFYIDARIPGKLFVCSDRWPCLDNLILVYGEAYRP